MERMPQPGEIYQHFKGNLYRIVTLAEHTETKEQMVVYQALYGDFKAYVRPLSMFLSEVDHDKYPDVQAVYRFTLVPAIGAIPPEDRAAAPLTDGSSVQKVPAPAEAETAAGGSKPADGGQEPSIAAEEEAFELDPVLLSFLEADSYEKKLEIYASLAGKADEAMLNTIAVSLDLELSGDTLEEQYEALKNCLLMLEKYECNRLR